MGLGDYYAKRGPKTGGAGNTHSGFSSNAYYSRNATSATKWSPPKASSGGVKQPLDTRRPYSGVGKFNVNLMGTPSSQPSPQLLAKPGAFEGVPVLGNIAGGLGELAKLDIGAIPFVGQALTTSKLWQEKFGEEYAKANPDEYTSFAATAAARGVKPEAAQYEFMRQNLVESGKVSPLLAGLFGATSETTAGAAAAGALGALNVGSQLVQRGLSGTGNRLENLRDATDEQLEGNTTLMELRDAYKAGLADPTLDQNQLANDTLDKLTLEGFAISNPLGQSDWANGIRNAAKGTPFQLPAEVVANVSAAALSLGLEIVTDPLTLLSLGAGTGLKIAGKGAARVVARFADDAARIALEAEERTLGRVLTKAEADVLSRSTRQGAMRSLYDTLPQGVPATEANLVQHGLKAGVAGLREATSAAGFAKPLVNNQHTLRWVQQVENALDPLTLFGKGVLGRASTKMASIQAVDGILDSLDRRAVSSVYSALEAAGVATDRVGGDLGTASANLTSQVGGELAARLYTRMGIGVEDAADPTALTNLGSDMLSREGANIRSLVKHKMEKVRHLVVAGADETHAQAVTRERTYAADLLVKMYGIDADAAVRATAGMSENELGVVRMLGYGNRADALLNARTVARGEAIEAGLDPAFADRFIFLGDNQLSRGKAKTLVAAIRAKDYVAVRAAVRQYDTLEFNLSQNMSDKELAKATLEVLHDMWEHLPQEVPEANLSPAMKAFRDRYGPDVEVGLRPDEVFSTGKNADGRITSVNPFMDYIRGHTVGIGDVAPPTAVQQWSSRLLGSISGSQVLIEQQRRFAQRMAADTGMTRNQSDLVLRLIRERANKVGTSSARGLTRAELYEAASEVRLSKRVREKMTERQLQMAVFWAHEGSLNKVGVSQKFTGKLKSLEVARVGTSGFGTLAERLYPNVRFRWNPMFIFQEMWESPILLTARGMLSPGQFTSTLDVGLARTQARAAEGIAGGAKRLGMDPTLPRQLADELREKANAKQGEYDELAHQTALMMDAFAQDSRFAADMIEGTDAVRWGSAAAARMAAGTDGQMLAKLKTDANMAYIKSRGQTVAFRRSIGEHMSRTVALESPVQWLAIKSYYGTLDDGEAGVRLFNDYLARSDPDSAFSAIKDLHNPGEFIRPSFLGARTRFSPRVVEEVLGKDMPGSAHVSVPFKDIRAAYMDPANPAVNDTWLEDTMRAAGADEWYIERTKWHLGGYETEDDFKKGLLKFMGEDEAEAIMESHRRTAQAEGVPLMESLADKYAGSPKSLDEAGAFKGNTLFQLIADGTEARGMHVVARDDPILDAYRELGQTMMPDLSMPTSHKTLAWEGHALAQHTELVPLRKLIDVAKGNAPVRLDKTQRRDLARSIKTHGMSEPVQLTYHRVDSTAVLDEGNHRVDVLRESIPEAKWDTTMVPVTVFTNQRSAGKGTKVRGKASDGNDYIPNNLRPSDIGFIGRGEAEYARNEATREVAVGKLTDAQKKGRDAQRIRAEREAKPSLGQPLPIEGGARGQLVAYGPNGEVKHRMGPGKTYEEWVEELENTLNQSELREHSDWYLDMRRGFLALNDNQQAEAVKLLIAFGATQLNTSPVDGMRFLMRITERLRRGETLPAIGDKELLKVAGLNGPLLSKYMEDGYLSSKGLGFKLIDFVDSLIGNDTRTIPVGGPNGRWGPVAGDIWAKRDVGYVDAKMLNHIKVAYGEQYDIVPVKARIKNAEGEWEDVTRSFTLTDKKTGRVHELGQDMVGGNPTDHEYDAIVEFYNGATDHLNTIKFLGRTDWTPPQAQALGWFKAKRVFGDETGDPRSAFFDNAWHVAAEVTPTRNAVASAVYPRVMEETTRGIAAKVGYQLGDEAAHLSGVRIISMNGSVRSHWEPGARNGRLATTVNYEVMASPEGAETFMATIGALAQQGDVRATRRTKTAPSANNNVRHAVELNFPASIDKEEMYGILKDLAESHQFFGDADLVRAADGTHVVRIVARAGETLPQFKARMDDVEMRGFYAERVTPEGYGRGRYVNPDEPLGPGVREADIKALGEQLVTDAQTDNLPLDYWAENAPSLTSDLYAKTRTEWGGDTIDLKNGKRPKAYGARRGGGPYATAVSGTKAVSPNASEAEFAAALDEFVAENRALLEGGHQLGVFHNKDTGDIEFDVNLIVDEFNDAEAVQLYLGRPGGAYDFTTGDGVYAPVFDPARAHGVNRTYAEVVEASNDWKAQPNGQGYLDVLNKPAKEDKTTRGRVAGELEREGIHWGRMVYEDAYQSVAARETAAHRATARELGDSGFDLTNPAGYLQSSPRGTRGASIATADARRGDALFQRTTPGGKPRGALTDPGAALSETGRRSQVYVSPKRKLQDTVAHEYAHDWVNRNLHPSAIRRVKDMYAGRSGSPPVIGAKSRATKLTVDEQEWLADQLVEYLRTGDIDSIPKVLQPLAAHYSKTMRANRRRPKLSAEAKDLFDSLDKVPQPKNAYNYDVDEQAILQWMYSAHRRADRMSADLIHFKTERSWMERSLNHPYFGLYPLSYMWGKVLPELVEFLAFRPFGLKAPLVGASMVNQMYQHVMLQMESDPDLRTFMTEHEDAFRALSMLVPGLPWDLPVNAPLWLRRYVEAAATNVANDQAGKKPEDYEAWNALVTDIDYARIAGDVVGYTYGPRAGTQSLLEYPGLAADFISGMQPEGTDPNSLKFTPPTASQPEETVPIPTQPTPPPPRVQQPEPTPTPAAPEGSVEELEAILGEQYAEVVENISE